MLINQFQWKLVDAGYGLESAREFGREMTLRLSKERKTEI